MEKIIGIIVILVLLIVFGIIIDILGQKRDFNKGKCRKCGEPLRRFKITSGGTRGYCCDACGHHIWIRWKAADKRYQPLTVTEMGSDETNEDILDNDDFDKDDFGKDEYDEEEFNGDGFEDETESFDDFDDIE
jgi:DNA-directed RNA polymerase subunit RPC12/RpoP